MSEKRAFFQINQKRNYGIDLLRILAMYMVVVLHILGQGGVLNEQAVSDANGWISWFLKAMCMSAVDIYALISGFVGYRIKRKYASLAELWLRVFFYSVLFVFINKLFFNPSLGRIHILSAFFPVTKGGLWYFTMYFALYFLSPVLNAAIEAMPRKGLRNAVAASVFLFSVIPFLWAQDTFHTMNGYSLLWLMILYLIGAYIGKYHVLERVKKRIFLAGYFGCTVLVWISKFILQNYLSSFMGYENNSDWLVNYTSLPVFLSAVFLLLLFRGLDLPAVLKKVVTFFAPLSFSVYVIHELPLFRQHVIRQKFAVYSTYAPVLMVLAVLGTAAGIYILCSAIDFARASVFNLLKVKERLQKIENKLIPDKQC